MMEGFRITIVIVQALAALYITINAAVPVHESGLGQHVGVLHAYLAVLLLLSAFCVFRGGKEL